MHCITLAELAAILAQHAPAIVYRRPSIPSEAIVQYWAGSRGRFELWHQAMARYRNAERAGDAILLRRWWREHILFLEEVLVSEMLTRVVAAIGYALDARGETDEVAPITHAIQLSHLEATNRVQHLMLRGRGSTVQDAVRLNRLRTGVERWTDALLGRISDDSAGLARYGFDQARVKSHAQEMRTYGFGAARETALWLMNAAMRDMLCRRTSPHTALPEANRNIAESVMMMLQNDLFDDLGTLKSLQRHRIDWDHQYGETAPVEAVEPDKQSSHAIDDYFQNDMQRWHIK